MTNLERGLLVSISRVYLACSAQAFAAVYCDVFEILPAWVELFQSWGVS